MGFLNLKLGALKQALSTAFEKGGREGLFVLQLSESYAYVYVLCSIIFLITLEIFRIEVYNA